MSLPPYQNSSYGFEDPLSILSLLIREGHDAVDASAKDGITVVALAGIASTVHAFESHPIKRFARGQKMPANVAIHLGTLSARQGKLIVGYGILAGTPDVSPSESDKMFVRVDCSMLDEFSATAIDLVRLDADGHEIGILSGATGLISSQRPSFIFRVTNVASIRGLCVFFQRLAYRGLICSAHGVASIEDASNCVGDAIFFPVERGFVSETLLCALRAWNARPL